MIFASLSRNMLLRHLKVLHCRISHLGRACKQTIWYLPHISISTYTLYSYINDHNNRVNNTLLPSNVALLCHTDKTTRHTLLRRRVFISHYDTILALKPISSQSFDLMILGWVKTPIWIKCSAVIEMIAKEMSNTRLLTLFLHLPLKRTLVIPLLKVFIAPSVWPRAYSSARALLSARVFFQSVPPLSKAESVFGHLGKIHERDIIKRGILKSQLRFWG